MKRADENQMKTQSMASMAQKWLLQVDVEDVQKMNKKTRTNRIIEIGRDKVEWVGWLAGGGGGGGVLGPISNKRGKLSSTADGRC